MSKGERESGGEESEKRKRSERRELRKVDSGWKKRYI